MIDKCVCGQEKLGKWDKWQFIVGVVTFWAAILITVLLGIFTPYRQIFLLLLVLVAITVYSWVSTYLGFMAKGHTKVCSHRAAFIESMRVGLIY